MGSGQERSQVLTSWIAPSPMPTYRPVRPSTTAKLSGVASSTHNHDAAYVNEGQANSVTSAMIVNGTILFADMGQNGCANGQVMKWNGSAWACAGDDAGAGADNLGNHTATQNIRLGAYWLSGDGGNEGISVDSSGNVTIKGDIKTDWRLNANTFIGVGAAGAGTLIHISGFDGWYNTAVGNNALYSNTTGNLNAALGDSALSSNTAGYANSAFGASALGTNTTGNNNSALGQSALHRNTTGDLNSAFGAYALESNTTGDHNSALGQSALNRNTTGTYNSALGSAALHSNTTGSGNSAVGMNALFSNTTGYHNSAVGGVPCIATPRATTIPQWGPPLSISTPRATTIPQ